MLAARVWALDSILPDFADAPTLRLAALKMRLERIKLAGFKSFVDPTVIPLPGNLVGVVGPNGCGKSNIIDAVRWVMGESSAKHLRGDSMADVIFNGSSTRKAVGVASVELVFDNSESDAAGEYAAYQKISIKRMVGRDGQSTYLLNGTRCRRKDITDLFLGTGLGARSYAIIEQGTISRLIEAKPDELRGIVEEAAGISRYKDRRHETEIRMRHTQENVDRLQDLRGELKKQVDHLQRQVKKAERYLALKEEERRAKAGMLRVRWIKYQDSLALHRISLDTFADELKECVSAGRQLDDRIAECRSEQARQQSTMQETQALFYELGAEISRLDDLIRRAEKSREDTLSDLKRLETERVRASEELERDRSELETIRSELTECQRVLTQEESIEREAGRSREAAEEALRRVRLELESTRATLVKNNGEADVLRSRGRQVEDQQRQLLQRRERLETERQELEANLHEQEMDALGHRIKQVEEKAGVLGERIERSAESLQQGQIRLQDHRERLNGVRAEIHTAQGRLSSLELLQQHAMGKDKAALAPWLEQMSLQEAPRLAECLEVALGWEDAVESVLGLHLEAVCVTDAQPYLEHLQGVVAHESVAFLETRPARATPGEPETLPRLIDQVKSPWDLRAVLGSVFCASDLIAAGAASAGLRDHESVITPAGERAGPGWVAVRRPEEGKAGVIQREREVREVKRALQRLLEHDRALTAEVTELDRQLASGEAERRDLELEGRRVDREILELRNQLHLFTARNQQASKRLQHVGLELGELTSLLLDLANSRTGNAEALQAVEMKIQQCEESRETIVSRVKSLERQWAEIESVFQSARDSLRRVQSRYEALQSSQQLTEKHLQRAEIHCSEASQRLENLRLRYEQEQPLEAERTRLAELRSERQQVEQQLAASRRLLAELEDKGRSFAEARLRNESETDGLKEKIEQTKIELKGNQIRLQNLQEQFEELGASPDQVEGEGQEALSETAWLKQINQLAEDLARLGPVNLMAVEEHAEQQARLEYLDEQHRDLSESLATLQQAIEKIDRECRALFKDTFDRINAGFQRTFPKLFGGGNACLELSERDLLEAGVSVIARPPGKRNSSIHLLSGGEKALTAIAMVFAIFELNPAPFCLLDEVDAPLDDANVGRFCGLVKEMSERVQFLFITHNKATMEIAQCLAGVTMKEPGVSRIVAVDIGEAVELATV